MVQTLCARILLNKTVIYMNKFHQSNFCYMNVLTNMNKILSYLNICFFRIQKIQYCLIRVKNFFTSYQWMWSLSWFQIKNKEALNKKWLHPLLKYTLVFLTIAIFIGYFFMIARESNFSVSAIDSNFTANIPTVTNDHILELEKKQSASQTNITEYVCSQCKY